MPMIKISTVASVSKPLKIRKKLELRWQNASDEKTAVDDKLGSHGAPLHLDWRARSALRLS
jgi:hypothetical protein